jgi:hypothetical protein
MATWDEVRSNLIDWYTSAAQRTEEWTRVGVGHYDRFGLERQLDRELATLGAEVRRILQQEDGTDVRDSEAVQGCLTRIRSLEQAIEAKQREINELRQKSAADPEPGPAEERVDSQ